MFLQRLRHLFSRLFTRLTGRADSPPLHPLVHQSTAATPVGHRQSTAANTPASGLASARWLDDTRRMRPHLATADRWTAPGHPSQTARFVLPDTLPIAPSRPPERAAGSTTPLYEPLVAVPEPEPESSAAESSAAGEDPLDSLPAQRQLMALKYLIRLGIYNEGFASSNVPDQYQHSMGIDESANEFWLPDNPESQEDTSG